MSQEHRDDLVETAQRYLPGGSSWMWTLPRDLSLVVDRAEGSHLIDTNGRRYIDYALGSGPLLLGHAHPALTAAVKAQIDRNVPVAERAHHPFGGDDLHGGAVRRPGSLREHWHRGDHVRDPDCARRHAARESPEVRGRLARPARLRARGHGTGGIAGSVSKRTRQTKIWYFSG